MASHALPPRRGSLLEGFRVQARVIGALIMRELHTRYGRENIGYLWVIGEPLLLATVVGIFHMSGSHAIYGPDIDPVPFSVIGYTTFILFRGIVNRSEGGIEANGPLLYHRMVKVEDITYSRAILEFCSTFFVFSLLMGLMVAIGMAQPPARPLYVIAGWMLIWFYSIGHSLIIAAISYENRTVGRLVHPYSYFMMFLSGAFIPPSVLPASLRDLFLYNPLVTMFEIERYGWFRAAKPDYMYPGFAIGACMVLIAIGLVLSRSVRSRIHLG